MILFRKKPHMLNVYIRLNACQESMIKRGAADQRLSCYHNGKLFCCVWDLMLAGTKTHYKGFHCAIAYSGGDERWFRRNMNALFPNAP